MILDAPDPFVKLLRRLLMFSREQCYTRGPTVVTVRMVFDAEAHLLGWTKPDVTRIEQVDSTQLMALLTGGFDDQSAS